MQLRLLIIVLFILNSVFELRAQKYYNYYKLNIQLSKAKEKTEFSTYKLHGNNNLLDKYYGEIVDSMRLKLASKNENKPNSMALPINSIDSNALVLNFFFDSKNNFKKKPEQFEQSLHSLKSADSLGKMNSKIFTNVNVIVSKINGTVFAESSNLKKTSIIHLNALVYSPKISTIDSLIRHIDTTTSRFKLFTHEFVPVLVSKEKGALFLFRAKVKDIGYSCNPNEDNDVVSIFKKPFALKYIPPPPPTLQLNQPDQPDQPLINRNRKLWMGFNTEYAIGNGIQQNSFIQNKTFDWGFSTLNFFTSIQYQLSKNQKNSFFIESGIGAMLSRLELSNNEQFSTSFNASKYNSITYVKNLNQTSELKQLILPFKIGYYFEIPNRNIGLSFSCGITPIIYNSMTNILKNGEFEYAREYKMKNENILVQNISELGLISTEKKNILLNSNKLTNSSLIYSCDLRLIYLFPKKPFRLDFRIGVQKVSYSYKDEDKSFISSNKDNLVSFFNATSNYTQFSMYSSCGIYFDLFNKK